MTVEERALALLKAAGERLRERGGYIATDINSNNFQIAMIIAEQLDTFDQRLSRLEKIEHARKDRALDDLTELTEEMGGYEELK